MKYRNDTTVLTKPIRLISIIFIVSVLLFLRFNLLDVPLERDEGNFGYSAQVILNGGIPYVDFLDHKPPLVFYIYAFVLLFFPSSPVGIHLFLLCYVILITIFIFLLAQSVFQSEAAGFGAAFVFVILSTDKGLQGFTASSEMLLLLPYVIGLWLAVKAIESKSWLLALLSGLFSAAACWTKQSAAILVLFTFLFIVLSPFTDNKFAINQLKASIRLVLFWLIGLSLLSVLIIFYFFIKEALAEFYYWSFLYGFKYTAGAPFNETVSRILSFLKLLLLGQYWVFIFAFISIVVMILKDRRTGIFIFLFCLFSFAAILPGQAYAHYLALLAPAVSVAAGGYIGLLSVWSINNRVRLTLFLLSVILLLITPVVVHPGYYIYHSGDEIARRFFGENPFPESVKLAEYIQKQTDKEENVLILGSEPQINFYSQRFSPTKIVMMYPLFAKTSDTQRFQKQFMRELEQNPPSIIIYTVIPYSFGWDGEADISFMKQVESILTNNYRLSAGMRVTYPTGNIILIDDAMKNHNKSEIKKYPILIFHQ